MPRRDGIDTNQEMLVDFNTKSHEVFVSAYERQFESGLADAYKGKPLTALNLTVRSVSRNTESTGDTIRREDLVIQPLDEDTVESMPYHLTLRNNPEDVHEYYRSLAKAIGATTLETAFDLRTSVPMNGIVSNYTAHLTDRDFGPTRHIGTYKEKPTKFSITLGKLFADKALSYIHSDDFPKTTADKLISLINGATLTHRFIIPFRSDIPLNGHESTLWLKNYANKMNHTLSLIVPRLERLEQQGMPASFIANEQKRFDETLAALEKAQEILAAR
jgi:hypothetical protein